MIILTHVNGKMRSGQALVTHTDLDKFKWESFMEDAVNLSSTGEFVGADLRP